MLIAAELPLDGGEPIHRISGNDLRALLDLSPAGLSDLVKREIAVKMGRDSYDLTATVGAYVRHLRGTASGRGGEQEVLTLTGERARLAREQADQMALKNAALRRELVPAAEVAREWGEALRAIRARVLAIPSRTRSALPHLTPADMVVLDREARAALEDLARGDGGGDAS